MATAECRKHPVRWLTVEDIRKQPRMRREAVVAAMLAGELPFSVGNTANGLPNLTYIGY